MDNIFHDVAPLLNPLAFFRALGRGAHDAFTQPPIPMREAFGRQPRQQPRQQQGMPFDDGFMPPQAMQGMPVMQGMQGMPAMPAMPATSASVPLVPAAAPVASPSASPDAAQDPLVPLRYGFNNGRYRVLDPAAPPLGISAEDWARGHQEASPPPMVQPFNLSVENSRRQPAPPLPQSAQSAQPAQPAASPIPGMSLDDYSKALLDPKHQLSELAPDDPSANAMKEAVLRRAIDPAGAAHRIGIREALKRFAGVDPYESSRYVQQINGLPRTVAPAPSAVALNQMMGKGEFPGDEPEPPGQLVDEPEQSRATQPQGQMAAPVQQASPPPAAAAAAAASPGGMSRREQIIQGLQDGSLDIDDEGNIHSVVAQAAPAAAAPGPDPGAVSAPPEPEAPFSQVPAGSQPVSAQGGMPAGYVPAPDAALDPYAEFRKRMLQNSLNADMFLQDQAEALAKRERDLNSRARYNNFWNNLSGAFGKGPSADVLKREQEQYQKSYDTLQNERQALMTSLVNRQNAVQNYMANTDPQAIANQVKMMKALADAQRVDYYGKDVDKRGQLGDRKADQDDKKIDLQAERQKWQAEESQARKQQIENDIRVKNETLKDLVMTGQMKRADYEARIKKMEADAENDAKRLGFNYDKLRSDERLQAQKIQSNEKIAGMNNSSREKVAADNNTAKMARTTTTQEYINDRQANKLVKGKPAATAEFINRMRVTPEKRQAYTKVMQHFANLTPEEQKAEAQKLKAYLKSNGMPIPAGL